MSQAKKNISVQKIHNKYFASCANGLETVLFEELQEIGVQKVQKTRGGVHFSATTEVAFDVMMQSRIASRIYKKVFKFRIKNEQDLYDNALSIHWEKLFKIDQYFKLKVIQSASENGKQRSKFKNSLFLTYKVKDAIIDYFTKKTKKRPDIDTKDPDISFLIHIQPESVPFSDVEDVEILVDLSGFPLFKRGYRFEKFEAPLKETLAAGLLRITGWDKKSPVVDFMCGSGTFLSEALLASSNTAATFKNKAEARWAFLDHLWYTGNQETQKAWANVLKKSQKTVTPAMVYGNDLSRKAIQATESHVKECGLEDFLITSQGNALDMMPPSEEPGLLVINPPYGERLGDLDELKVLYKRLGDHFKQNWKGWHVFMLVGDLELIKHVGLRSTRKHIIFNGPIECRWVEYQLY